MAQPQAYNREVDFTERDGDDTNHSGVNTELDAAALSINEIRDNLALIQKDDGSLQNGIVTADSLAPSAFDAVAGQLADATQDAQEAASAATLAATTALGARDTAVASASAASTSESNAASSAAGAATAAQTLFNGLWLGAQAADPTLDLNGQPLTTGDFYYNTTAKLFRAYDAAIPGFTSATPSGQFKRPKYVAGVDFTAGVTTALTLASDPITAKNIFVFFDGVAQHNDQFSLSGTTLTFTSAIPVGVSAVEVAYIEVIGQFEPFDGSVTDAKIAPDADIASSKLALTTELAASSGASLIGYVHVGTGAVASSVQTELRRWVWADHFGADPTGATDCTTAIQNAINTGNDVYFTKGATYKAQAATLNITTAKQSLYLQGCLLNISNLNVNADNVTVDLGGGELRGPVKVGQLSATGVAGTNTLTLTDASEFVPGDILVSSYGDNATNWPLNGQTGIEIQSINYTTNVVTLVSNLLGVVNIPTGTYVGDFQWGALIGINASKNVVFRNGLMTRANGYFLSSWRWNQPDFLTNIPIVRFENLEFRDCAYDHFIFVRTKADFINCKLGKCFDVAKQGIVYGDNAQIYMERCHIARGNFDLDFVAISDAGRSTYFQGTTGYIRCVDCYFDGTNKLPSATYFSDNSLHCVQWGSGGANHSGVGGVPSYANFTEYSFERCEFYNYTRSLFSTTYTTDSNTLVADRVTFNNCQSSVNPFHVRIDYAAGKQAIIKNFAFNNCNFYTTGGYTFAEAYPNSVFQAVFTDCYLKVLNSDPSVHACKFVRGLLDVSPTFKVDDRCEFIDLTLRGSKVVPITTASYVPVKGSFIIDDANFTANSDGAVTAFIELGYVSGFYGQGGGATARSKNGSLVYDLGRFNNETWANANIYEGWPGQIYGLFGDDWMVGSAHVKSASGGYYKSTYSLKVKLQNAASGGATSVVVNTVSYPGNQPAIGDRIFIKLDDGQVFVTTISGAYSAGSTTITLTTALPSAAAANNGVSFLRLVAL